ncbi:Vacuolar morphogenesis protein 6 [Serendipita sp. 399]|nr:Vacuolar morphogenesis protein 6 [Serendipita sp. 399]
MDLDEPSISEGQTMPCEHLKALETSPSALLSYQKALKWSGAGAHGRGLRRRKMQAPCCGTCEMPLRRPALCLDCRFIGCWSKRHIQTHLSQHNHNLGVDMLSGAIFCQPCDDFRPSYFQDLEVLEPVGLNAKEAKGKRQPFHQWRPSDNENSQLEKTTLIPCDIRRGFLNLGATCYMSVVLQAFLHNPLLRNYFLSDKHNSQLCGRQACMCCELDQMFSEVFTPSTTPSEPAGGIAPIGPLSLLRTTWESSTDIAGYAQQDAHEFFIAVLNQLHLCSVGSSNGLACTCVVHQVFAGQLQSEVKCGKCGHVNPTVDPMLDISLELKDIQNGQKTTLASCLRRFTEQEKLPPKAYVCSNCQSSASEATKQLSIKKLPPVLCIQLKRFEHKSSATKIDTPVQFPGILNMAPYTTAVIGMQRHKAKDKLNPPNTSEYELFAVINHEGQLNTGHYTNFARSQSEWYRFDDEKVTHATLKECLNSVPYMCFYVKRQLEYGILPTPPASSVPAPAVELAPIASIVASAAAPQPATTAPAPAQAANPPMKRPPAGDDEERPRVFGDKYWEPTRLQFGQGRGFHATLEDTKRGLTRRSIDQLGIIKDIYTLVSLSDTVVNLHPLPALTPTQTLQETRGALCFALDTSILYTNPDGTTTTANDPTVKQVPAVVTLLAVGCKRRMLIYTWKDGEIQNPLQDINLPHSPRAMAFPTSKVIAIAYTQTDHALLYLDTRSVAEVVLPNTLHPSSSTGLTGAMGMGMNAISGLGGYMTLSLGAKTKPSVIKIAEGEFVIPKETSTLFLGTDGKPSRKLAIEWPAAPEETSELRVIPGLSGMTLLVLALVKPYLLSILPGTAAGASTQTPNPVIQVRSSLTLSVAQTISYPFGTSKLTKASPASQYSLRLLSTSSASTAPLFLISAPNDRTSLAAEGSTLWMFNIRPWSTQIDELVAECRYSDALALLETLEEGVLPEKIKRRAHIQALHGVALIAQHQFEAAFEIFLKLDLNPAKIVAMYPVEISGRLSKPESSWTELFGEKLQTSTGESPLLHDTGPVAGSADVAAVVDEDNKNTEAVSSEPSRPKLDNKSKEYRDAVDRLLEYLTQRRQKIKLALSSINIMTSDAAKTTRLSEASVEELMGLPDAPPTALTPEQLFKFAQIVDTALFKSYLTVKPGLIGPLCRLDNWCEVSEVQNELRARGKFTELKYLYQGKRMHKEALALLKDLGEKETDLDEQLDPTVAYLQNLGQEYLSVIFEGAQWVLERDKNKGFHIFTSEEHELPRDEVADFLGKIDPMVSTRFVEFLIDEKKETDSRFHDRLGELYLNSALEGDLPDARTTSTNKFISFLRTSKYYHPDRLLASLPHDEMLEARAILLGRLGDHKAALSIYVYDLQSFSKAEEYCKQLHLENPGEQGVYMLLLNLYLRPEANQRSTSSRNQYLQPALDLISKHSPRLDAVETLQLLPPLVTASSVQEYLCEALRTPRVHVRMEKELWKARSDQVSQNLMTYESRRVKITDSRLCPQCHKRLDRAAIAVHAPRGEVTHYHCREAFSEKLKGKERILHPTVL